MKAEGKLKVYWSKRERDIIFQWSAGASCSYLFDIFNDEFRREMEDRGYDITTLKFSIELKKGNKRFVSQREEGK